MSFSVDTSLTAIDWDVVVADLVADDFSNGRTQAALRRSFEQSQHVAIARADGRVVGTGAGTPGSDARTHPGVAECPLTNLVRFSTSWVDQRTKFCGSRASAPHPDATSPAPMSSAERVRTE